MLKSGSVNALSISQVYVGSTGVNHTIHKGRSLIDLFLAKSASKGH